MKTLSLEETMAIYPENNLCNALHPWTKEKCKYSKVLNKDLEYVDHLSFHSWIRWRPNV